jgi:hypothetical protein
MTLKGASSFRGLMRGKDLRISTYPVLDDLARRASRGVIFRAVGVFEMIGCPPCFERRNMRVDDAFCPLACSKKRRVYKFFQ